MRIYKGRDYKYRIRTPIKEKNISSEYLHLANALKTLVDTEGQEIYRDISKLEGSLSSAIQAQHILMLKSITSQINILISNERFVDEETITEQMYCSLLREGYSRNIIIGILYAVFFSLNKTLKLSNTERKKLRGKDTFTYQKDATVIVNNDNVEEIKARIEQDDNNARVEFGRQILSGKIESYKGRITYAKGLVNEGLNYGSGNAARILGTDSLIEANNRLIPNDDYSRAYEYYTIYGAVAEGNGLKTSQTNIVDILNLGIYNRKMLVNYLVVAILCSLSFFIPTILDVLHLNVALSMPIAIGIVFSVLEIAVVIVGGLVRYFKPFFTQSWIFFLQILIWFVAMIIMIP